MPEESVEGRHKPILLEGIILIEFNYRGTAWFVLIALMFIAATIIVVQGAHAEDANQSYVIVTEPVPESVYQYHEPYRIDQGQTVYVNDTIDIAGMGHGKLQIAWYGKYSEYDSPQYIITTSLFKRTLINFWLDPVVFESRTGRWYQYYGNETERNGNLEAFTVSYRPRNITTPFNNVTEEVVKKPIYTPPLPEKRITDYLVARGDSLTTNSSRVWIFGTLDGMYSHGGYFSPSEIGSLDIGSYKMVLHDPGRNGIFEVNYDAKSQLLTSPWKNVHDESVAGSQPMLDMDKFYQRVKATDDRVQTFNLEVQIPEIYVDSIDEVAVGSRIPVAYAPGMTLLDVRGYTNSMNETVVTAILDPDIQTIRTLKDTAYTTTAIREHPGSMSSYQVYIPINKNEMPNGIHTVKVSTEIGSFMLHDFPVSELPVDSFVPNATLKYIGDRNPWIPTPTPEIIVKNVEVQVTQIVTVQVTPSDAQVSEAAKKIIDKQNQELEVMVVIGAAMLLALAFIGWFVYSIWRAKKK